MLKSIFCWCYLARTGTLSVTHQRLQNRNALSKLKQPAYILLDGTEWVLLLKRHALPAPSKSDASFHRLYACLFTEQKSGSLEKNICMKEGPTWHGSHLHINFPISASAILPIEKSAIRKSPRREKLNFSGNTSYTTDDTAASSIAFHVPFLVSDAFTLCRRFGAPSALAGADNGLVAGSSPPGPTTQSCANPEFPVSAKHPRFSAVWGGCHGPFAVSAGNEDRPEADWGPSSLASEIRFPVRGEGPARDSVRMRQRPVCMQEIRDGAGKAEASSADDHGETDVRVFQKG
jgi:hypothetical protein